MRSAIKILFWSIACLLVLSLVFTIIGSSLNYDGLLNAGIIGWLVTSFLVFAWFVLWIWTGTKRYKK